MVSNRSAIRQLVFALQSLIYGLPLIVLLNTGWAQDDLKERINAFVEPLIADELLTGNLIIEKKGKILFEASYGMANIEHQVENTSETRFCIASLSKPMTSLAVANLIAQKKMSASDTVDKWIKDFPEGDVITVRHLLWHRAGIPHRVTTPDEEDMPTTAAEMVERIKQVELLSEPGKKYRYSTAGYSVLARIIECVTNKAYDEAMRELIFDPLGMNSTSHVDNRAILAHRASPYAHGPEGLEQSRLADLSFLVGGGSLYSTARDVLRFGQACARQEGLDAKVYLEYRRLGSLNRFPIHWNGRTSGFAAFLDIYREPDMVVVFTGNAGAAGSEVVRHAIPSIVAGIQMEPPKRLPKSPILSTDQLKKYTLDTYGASKLPLVVRNGVLCGKHGGALKPLPNGRFYSYRHGCEMEFEKNADGEFHAMIYYPTNGNPIRIPRNPRD